MTRDGARRRRAAFLLAALAIVAAALAVWAQFTGGFRTHVAGIPISIRGALRPALAAALLGAAALHLLDAWRWRIWGIAARRLAVAPPLIAAAASLGVLAIGLRYGSKATGGSDVYGYISQAMLWLKGDLLIRQEFAASMPWPDAAWTFSPLGYRPAEFAPGIIPTYAPGTALLMALATLLVGHCGPYVVGPLCGAALVWLTYRLGVRMSRPVVGVIAACCLAVSPTVIFMANWPMSDVPVAAFWTASLVAAMRPTLRSAAVAGTAAGIAVLIRPNLAPLAAVPAALTFLMSATDMRRGAARVAVLALACAPFVGFVAWLFDRLYGSSLVSGYGDLSSLYAWPHAAPNLKRYPQWFYDSQGPLAFLWIAAPVIALWRRDVRLAPRLLLVVFALLLFGFYVFYAPFDSWLYLRFLLPAFPVAFVLAADAAWEASTPLGWWRRGLVMALVGFGLVSFGLSESDGRGVLTAGRNEQRFADVGTYVATALPQNAVVIALQHGGNVRFYGNRLSLRYDILAPGWLDRTLAHLRSAGYEPYILLEDSELPKFRERFAGQEEVAAIDRMPLAVTLDGIVRLYGTGERTVGASAVIPRTVGCVPPHPVHGY